MKIVYENRIETIVEAVKNKAMYSKVMLLFDDYVSTLEIEEIYSSIKDLCIFNKLNVKEDLTEVFNGYKLLIFCCDTTSFLSCQLPLKEFCNVYVPTDCGMLPYFVSGGKNDIIILKNNTLDANVFCSFAFNKFYAYINGLFNTQDTNFDVDFCCEDITPKNVTEMCQNLPEDMQFVDVEILKKTGIDYNLLPIVDYVLINAFLVVVEAIKSNTLCLADFYKYDKDNYEIIDKFYTIANNDLLVKLVQYNFVSIQVVLSKAKQKIENCLSCVPAFTRQELNAIIEKIKHCCKLDEGLLAYLYLYDVL